MKIIQKFLLISLLSVSYLCVSASSLLMDRDKAKHSTDTNKAAQFDGTMAQQKTDAMGNSTPENLNEAREAAQSTSNELPAESKNNAEDSRFPFKNRALNVVVWSSLGTVFSAISYYSTHAAIYRLDLHYSVGYGAAITPFPAIACWTIAAENLSELYKDYKRKCTLH